MLDDGAAGLANLKRCGGTTVVQNSSDAAAPAMPSGALNTSYMDYRAALADIPGLLREFCRGKAGPLGTTNRGWASLPQPV